MKYEEAVASQPENLEATRTRVADALVATDLSSWREGTLAVVAMGAGSNAGWVLVDALRRAGRRAVNLDASVFLEELNPSVFADCFVLVSEGGRSSETVGAAQRLARGGRLGLTNVADSPLAREVDVAVTIGHGEDSAVYTVGYTATLQALGLLAAALGSGESDEDFVALPALVRTVLADAAGHLSGLGDVFTALGAVDFVGSRASFSSATEGALLFREATRTPTAAFETRQYLHGPMESLADGRGCVVFGDGREVELAHYLAEREIPVLLVTSLPVQPAGSLSVMPLPTCAPIGRAVLEIAPVQLLAGTVARGRGLGIEGFVYRQNDTKLPRPGDEGADER